MPESMRRNASPRPFCCQTAWLGAEPGEEESWEEWYRWFDNQPPSTVDLCQRCNGGVPVGAP